MISGSEIAFFSLTPLQLNEINISKSKKYSLILSLLKKPKRLLATILISNNFINVSIIILSSFIVNRIFNFENHVILGFILQVFVITSIILLFGEIMPKIYANQFSLKFALIMAKPLSFLCKFFYPFSSLLINSTSIIDKRINKKGHNISMSELSDAIDITSDKDTQEEEKKMLKGIAKFGDIEVREIMKPRLDVVAVDSRINFIDLLKIINDCGYSRIPTYKNNFDNVIGILYIKDLLPHLNKTVDFNWNKLLREVFFVPENKKINDLLKEFQEKKIHMAVIVDEYGGTSGIITLEDIIEEIVGEISDEYDTDDEELNYEKIDEKNYIFNAKISLNDFSKIINVDDSIFDEVKGESDTIAGLIIELEGKIPNKNESVNFQNFVFTILSVDKRRIKKVKLSIND